MGIGNRGNQGCGNQRTDAGNVIKSQADFARAMPGKDAAIRFQDLLLDQSELIAQRQQTGACLRRYALIVAFLYWLFTGKHLLGD